VFTNLRSLVALNGTWTFRVRPFTARYLTPETDFDSLWLFLGGIKPAQRYRQKISLMTCCAFEKIASGFDCTRSTWLMLFFYLLNKVNQPLISSNLHVLLSLQMISSIFS